MTKKSRQKLKFLENEKSFWGEIKAFFIIFKRLSVAKNCLRAESAPIRNIINSVSFSILASKFYFQKSKFFPWTISFFTIFESSTHLKFLWLKQAVPLNPSSRYYVFIGITIFFPFLNNVSPIYLLFIITTIKHVSNYYRNTEDKTQFFSKISSLKR